MLRNRLLTAGLLGGLFLAALYGLPDLGWSLFLLLFIVIGAWEWGGLTGAGRSGRIAYAGATAVAGGLMLPCVEAIELVRHWGAVVLMPLSALFWIVLAPIWLVRRWRMPRSAFALAVGWLLLLPAWIALGDLRQISPQVVLAVMATVILADSAAYFSGKRFGRRKLAPEISPGKTWEGLAGAVLAVSLFATGLCVWRGLSYWFVVGFLALTILSVMGDLFESLVKRQAGQKDSGSLLPGHGGVLDRIDGLTSTLPLVAFYVYLPYYFRMLFVP